jgi:hypothetical protein
VNSIVKANKKRRKAMGNFKDFLKSSNKKEISTSSSSQELAAIISSSLAGSALSITRSDRNKFAEEAVKIAHSDEVLTELSQSIGEPKETESEDEFVARSKSALSKIIKQKLME